MCGVVEFVPFVASWRGKRLMSLEVRGEARVRGSRMARSVAALTNIVSEVVKQVLVIRTMDVKTERM